MNFNHYFSNEEIASQTQTWLEQYPTLIQREQIGASHDKRPIWLLTITNQETGAAESKPALWMDGNIHATELAGCTATMYMAHHLLEGFSTSEQIHRLLDTCTYYIVPRVNPDGAAMAMAKNPRYLRSGTRPYPWEEMADGLHEQDINGDGKILQMRIPDANGDWKISPLNPRLMALREPDDMGEGPFYRILPEGLLENYDGYIIEEAPPLQRLDFNRNFPFEWKPENEQSGAGNFPASEVEIRALVEAYNKRSNVNIVLTFHTFSRVLLRPYSTRADDTIDRHDLEVFKKMGSIGTRLTGYRNVSTFHDFTFDPKHLTYGAFDDWVYDHYGAYSFTVELWDLPTEAGIKDRSFTKWSRDHPHEEDILIFDWILKNGLPDSYVDWQAFDHPQLGKIELGGWNSLYSWRNPPHTHMEAEAARHLPWVLSLSEMLPRLTIHTLETEKLGEKAYRIRLVVENNGFLPTYTSHQAKSREVVRPVRAELVLPDGASLVSGKIRQEAGYLEGRSNKMYASLLWASSITDNRQKVEWVVNASPGSLVKVRVLSERAGRIEKEIVLG
jgi:murein tripeptide amidase MpaA